MPIRINLQCLRVPATISYPTSMARFLTASKSSRTPSLINNKIVQSASLNWERK
ncbi:hypothetical protein THIOM_001084 [Candidatus Thiomargarita nelsonii]|uniref:Uncharacterized protein n=1 Tax=Candidatus Thiomargarita nelsonii TaxID=1003181 RepID=A0A176S5A2_9GAMM|nr:hypothetical protein THIOM_001084 [Candidatus Thiomargarita nelsonii]